MRLAFLLLICSALPLTADAAAPSSTLQAANAKSGFVRNAPLPAWSQPLAEAPETRRTDAIVMRLAETQAYIGKTHAYLVNQVIQANDRSALAEIGQFSVDYMPAYQRLLLHKLAIIRQGKVLDRTASANMRLLEQETAAHQGVYGGTMTLKLLLDDVQLGDSLWITYTVEGSNPVFGNKWAERYSVERGSPVELRRLTLLQESGRAFRWTHAGDLSVNRIEPVVDNVGKLKRTRFEWKNLEAVLMEPSIPVNYFPVQFLHLTEYKDWNEVARWAGSLFPTPPASPQLDALVRQLGREPDPAARAAAALQWVQDEIRYFSVSIGENSHRPQNPDVVLKRRYGDCKDKTYLLVTLLRRLGIAADPLLVNANGPRVPGRLLPSPTWFDHVVVQLSLVGKTFIVDPTRTGEKGAIAIRPAVLPGGTGLLVTPATSGLLQIPDAETMAPRMERREKLILATLDGPATLEVSSTYRDSSASSARRYYPSLSANELAKEVLSGHEKQYKGLVLAGTPQLIDSDDGSTYEVRFRFTLASPVTMSEGEPGVTFDTTIMESTLQIPDKVVRNFPFALPYGKYHARYHMEIVWPELTRGQPYAPAATSVDTPYFSARDELSLRGRTMHYLLEYRVKSDEVAAASLPDMQSKVSKLNPYVSVTLRRKEGFTVLENARNMPLRELDLTRWAVTTMELAKNKASRTEIGSAAYCETVTDAFAHSVPMGQKLPRDRFVAQIASATDIKEVPCSAIAAFKAGNFADAARRFSQGPALEDGHQFVPRQAWSAFHSGSTADALKHMDRYVNAQIKAGTLNSSDLADALALYQRAGKNVPALLLDQVPGDLAPWPRPVIAMQLGQITPEQLVAQAEKLSGDERDTALNDAWFHIAQYHFARGEQAAGLEALRWYPANGIVSTDRFAQAFAELWHLEQSDTELQAGLAAWNADRNTEAVALFRRAAERKVPYAWLWLGVAYGNGVGVKQDFAQAKYWLEQAAQAGVSGAMNDLGVMAENGEGGPKDLKAAVAWYTRAARHGDFNASQNLGHAYSFGTLGLAQDFSLSFKYYRQGAQLGNPKSQAGLSSTYRLGEGRAPDPTMAYVWAITSSNLGNTDGMVELAILTLEGKGTEKDPKKALALFKKAADRDNSFAALRIAQMYDFGDGVPADPREARDWYLKAAKNGSAPANLRLGEFSTQGIAGRVDHVKALEWYKAAADGGEAEAHTALGNSYADGSGVEKNRESACRHYRSGAELGNAEAMWKLGKCYLYGRGVDKDLAVAVGWYRKASDLGYMNAVNDLGELYERGEGVPLDLDQALALYRRAATAGHGLGMHNLGTLFDRGLGVPRDHYAAYIYYGVAQRAPLSKAFRATVVEKQAALVHALTAEQKAKADALIPKFDAGDPLPGFTAPAASGQGQGGK